MWRQLVLALATAACAVWSVMASAQTYPSRPVTMVVPFAAGGTFDVVGRIIAPRMSELLGQQVIVENATGAGGIVGVNRVANAAPDGYMVLVSAVASVLVPPNLSTPPAFDALKDLTPVTGIGTVPAVLVVKPSLGIKTLAELLDYAKANPGKLNLATSGAGTISHLTGELLMRETGIKIVPVHYRGAPPAVTDLREFNDRGHSLTIDHGWHEIADEALSWLGQRHK